MKEPEVKLSEEFKAEISKYLGDKTEGVIDGFECKKDKEGNITVSRAPKQEEKKSKKKYPAIVDEAIQSM